MAITLDGIDLPIDLIWSDAFGWSNVVQNVKKSVTGSLIIQEASQAKGRLITLTGGQDSSWVDKLTVEALKTKVDTPDLTMTLVFHSESFQVRFARQGNKSPFEAREIYELADPDDEHIYGVTIRLMEV